MNKLEYKTLRFKAIGEPSDTGIVEAVVSVFGVLDFANEIVDAGAFDVVIGSGVMPKILVGHDWDKSIGLTLEWRVLPPNDPLLPDDIKQFGGLYCKGQIEQELFDGQQAFIRIKKKIIEEYSIGYEVIAEDWADGVRHLKELRVYEWSPVFMGANPETYTIGTKALQTMNIETKVTNIRTLLDGLVEQSRIHLELREKAGRPINAVRWGQLNALAEQLHNASKEMRGLLAETDPSQYAGKHIDPRLYLKMKQLKGFC